MRVGQVESFEPDWASPGDWAAMYRAAGLQVVPCYAPSEQTNWKRPALADWKSLQEEMVPQATFERWYGPGGENARRSNMGVLSGRASGNVFVIDLDEYKDGQALRWWHGVLAEHNNSTEPETWQQTTGGGGRQIFFKAPEGWRTPTNKTPIGVDIRGQGGFAVLPPSLHMSGKSYAWRPGASPWECELATAPDWLLHAVSELVERFGGDQHRETSNELAKINTPSPSTDFDAFGARVDGRDHYMRDMIWASVIDWWRENPIPPTESESQARMREAYSTYERKVKSRLVPVSGETNGMLLEREGRGATLFAEKWRRAISKWSTEIAEAGIRGAPAQPQVDPWDAEKPVAARFVFEKIGDLRKLPPVQWLVESWIPEGSTGIFYGKWAAGKSFIGFDLSLHLAYGMEDWHGAKLPAGGVEVLVIAREGHQGFVNRIDAFKKHHGLVDDAMPITFMRGSVSFMRDEEFAALCEAITATGSAFKLVLVDTVARVLPGVDMNEQQTVTTFMERMSVISALTGAAAIGVHHQNKSGGMMGSTFFEANADFVFEVTRTGEEDQPLSSGEIVCTKMKDGEDRWKRVVSYQKIALSIAADGPSSLVVDKLEKPSAAASGGIGWPDRETCRRILNAVNEAWIAGKPLSSKPQSRTNGRYAPAFIASEFQVSAKLAAQMIETWLMNDVLSIEVRDAKLKVKGLKVVGSL